MPLLGRTNFQASWTKLQSWCVEWVTNWNRCSHNYIHVVFESKSQITTPSIFKIKFTFGHKLRYEINITFGEISQTLPKNWNVVINNVNVVVDELPSQIIFYNRLTIDIWNQQRPRTSTWFYALWCHPSKMASFQWN